MFWHKSKHHLLHEPNHGSSPTPTMNPSQSKHKDTTVIASPIHVTENMTFGSTNNRSYLGKEPCLAKKCLKHILTNSAAPLHVTLIAITCCLPQGA
jgi:hypothetical protein